MSIWVPCLGLTTNLKTKHSLSIAADFLTSSLDIIHYRIFKSVNGSRPGFIQVCVLIHEPQWLLNNKAPAETWENEDRAFSVVIQLCIQSRPSKSGCSHLQEHLKFFLLDTAVKGAIQYFGLIGKIFPPHLNAFLCVFFDTMRRMKQCSLYQF